MPKHKTSGAGPRLKRKEYEKALRRLQAELRRLQDWVRQAGLRVIVVLEGRDAAGKGIQLIKIWLEVSDREQKRRFEARIDDPLRQWKLSPMDLPSRSRWLDHSRARDMMLAATDTAYAPWYILRSDDTKRARLNGIRHLLDLIPHEEAEREGVGAAAGAFDGGRQRRPGHARGAPVRAGGLLGRPPASALTGDVIVSGPPREGCWARVRRGMGPPGGILAIVGVALASGCLVGPDYTPPEVSVNGAWQQSAGAGEVNLRWWETLNDAVLSSLIERSIQQNLTLRAAGLRVLEARAARGIAVGQFFPQLQEVFGEVTGTRLSEGDVQTGDQSFWDASFGLQAAWELDFWGRFRRGIEAADAEVMFSVADYDAVLVSLIADVATNYVLIRALEERLGYARQNEDLQAETLELTEARFRAGAVSELDVSTARATLANTRALIPDLENSLRQTTLALNLLLGATPSDLDGLLGPGEGGAGRVPEAPPELAAGIPAELLRRRPDVRAAERLAAAQSARIGQATADLFPRIEIAGSTGFASSTFGGRSDLGEIFDADSFAGFIGLRVNWPILNYGRIQGNIRVQDARYEQAVAAYQESVLRAAGEVESGLSAFLRSRERSAHLAEAVEASARSTELSLIQYRAGAVDFIRVNDAQTDLVEQQDNLVVARAAIVLGAIGTYRALGGGWEVREGREFIDAETAGRMRERTDWGDVLAPAWEEGADLGFPRPETPDPGRAEDPP